MKSDHCMIIIIINSIYLALFSYSKRFDDDATWQVKRPKSVYSTKVRICLNIKYPEHSTGEGSISRKT